MIECLIDYLRYLILMVFDKRDGVFDLFNMEKDEWWIFRA